MGRAAGSPVSWQINIREIQRVIRHDPLTARRSSNHNPWAFASNDIIRSNRLQRIGGGTQGYDVIGDIHGHASALESLLTGMGYIRRDGAYAHPERIAIFVGDFVDRGSENLHACQIVMDMHMAGADRKSVV